MAIRYPKPVIEIANFQQGIASSVHAQDGAIGFCAGIDLFTYPGIARSSNALKSATFTGTTLNGNPRWIVTDPNTGYLFMLTDTGRLYHSQDSGQIWGAYGSTPSNYGTGGGLAWWKTYIVVVNNHGGSIGTFLDLFATSSSASSSDYLSWSGGPTFVNKFTGANFPLLSSQNDGFLYIADGQFVHFVQEVQGDTFDPNSSSTYTTVTKALTIANAFQISVMEELRADIVIGANIPNIGISNIFPWDRTQGYLSFNFPVKIQGEQIYCMKNVADTIYFMAGKQGNLYSFTESGIKLESRVPVDIIKDITVGYLTFNPGAMCAHNGRILIGASNGYIFSYNNGAWGVEYIPSDGTVPTSWGAIYSVSISEFVAGSESTDGMYYLDYIGNKPTAYVPFLDSLLYESGSRFDAAQYNQIEINFSRKLASGDGIKVYYRTNLTDSKTGTQLSQSAFDYDTFGAVSQIVSPISLHVLGLIQLHVAFEGNAEIRSIRLIPNNFMKIKMPKGMM